MNANFDADLEELEDGLYTVRLTGEVEVLLFQEGEADEALDDLTDKLTE